MNIPKLFVGLVALTLMLTACTGSAEKDLEVVDEVVSTEAPTSTSLPPTPEPSATEAMVMMPVSMVSGELGVGEFNAYKVSRPDNAPLQFEESELPAAPGSVIANWFTSGGFYVVGYYGLDLDAAGALCPGNSILTAAGFQHISNAPTMEGACEGFTTLTQDPEVGPLICHGTLFYRTAIPSDLQGTLFGTIEMLDLDGNLVGITSQAESNADMLEIDLIEMCQ